MLFRKKYRVDLLNLLLNPKLLNIALGFKKNVRDELDFASFSSITSVFAILLLLVNQRACFFVRDQCRNCKYSLLLLICMRVKFFSTIRSFQIYVDVL